MTLEERVAALEKALGEARDTIARLFAAIDAQTPVITKGRYESIAISTALIELAARTALNQPEPDVFIDELERGIDVATTVAVSQQRPSSTAETKGLEQMQFTADHLRSQTQRRFRALQKARRA